VDHVLVAVVLALVVSYLMVLAGTQKRALERHPLRRCPSCGRLRRDCSCVR